MMCQFFPVIYIKYSFDFEFAACESTKQYE